MNLNSEINIQTKKMTIIEECKGVVRQINSISFEKLDDEQLHKLVMMREMLHGLVTGRNELITSSYVSNVLRFSIDKMIVSCNYILYLLGNMTCKNLDEERVQSLMLMKTLLCQVVFKGSLVDTVKQTRNSNITTEGTQPHINLAPSVSSNHSEFFNNMVEIHYPPSNAMPKTREDLQRMTSQKHSKAYLEQSNVEMQKRKFFEFTGKEGETSSDAFLKRSKLDPYATSQGEGDGDKWKGPPQDINGIETFFRPSNPNEPPLTFASYAQPGTTGGFGFAAFTSNVSSGPLGTRDPFPSLFG